MKSFERFVFEADDTGDLILSPQQLELNKLCFEMKRLASLQFRKSGDSPERDAEIKQANAVNKTEIFRLWHKALPMLVAQYFTHYLFTYGLRNVERKPMKKLMQLAAFSMEVPRLSFLLADKGDYYELFLRFKIKNRILQFGVHTQALFLINARQKPNLWYLLEAEQDTELVDFFGRVGFKIQVPKDYYETHFERYVMELEQHYEMEYK
ncbi:hypothetical protein [Pedobacter sp.]|uniref:hypothetical protein n=1 Tax=Pedobacter sp. TaxID=1411316 RepID=UPI003BAD915B